MSVKLHSPKWLKGLLQATAVLVTGWLLFGPETLFLIPAQGTADTPTTVASPTPQQLEGKFQLAYTSITEKYVERVYPRKLLRAGFKAALSELDIDNLTVYRLVPTRAALKTREEVFEIFRSGLRQLRTETGGTVDLEQVVALVVKGMADSLGDDYSTYLEPQRSNELQLYLKGETESYGGIGVEIQFRDGECHVIRPIPDSPAYRAGILPGDQIERVSGETLPTQARAIDLLKGDPGTDVEVTVVRSGVPEPLVFVLTREIVYQPELQKTLLPGKVGYVRINSFNAHSAEDLEENLHYLKGLGMKACILDLRQNFGGLLPEAVSVADVFLRRGSTVVTIRGREASNAKTYQTSRNQPFSRLPLVVLVDAQTASAAEIVTGAIRDNRRGKTVGMTTFGKGTVQEIIPLPDRSALKLTVARYYTPTGEGIDKKGIEPDYKVSLDPRKVYSLQGGNGLTDVDLDEVAEDRQLKKALALLGVPIPTPGTGSDPSVQ